MRILFCTALLSLSLFSFSQEVVRTFSEQRKYRLQLYNQGREKLLQGKFGAADSLFTLAVEEGDFNNDTYFNRAIAKSKMHNTCGFCVDLASAAILGDVEANQVFWKSCPQKGSHFICTKDVEVTISDSLAQITFADSAKTNGHTYNLHKQKGLTLHVFKNTKGEIDTIDISTAIYDLVRTEIPPQFPGGDAELYRFLQKNIRYPMREKENGIQGKVFVTCIIDNDGTVTNVELFKGVKNGSGINAEALRVINLMPKWKPGNQNGKAVRVRIILPIQFKLT